MADSLPKGWHSRGYLPHFDGGEMAQSINLRLADSLPQTVLNRWRLEVQHESSERAKALLYKRVEGYLDQGYGICYLKDSRIAEIVQDSLLHYDGERYKLLAWVIMPNHVHILFVPGFGYELSQILKSFKGYTARMANRALQRLGEFWMEDYFDRFIRDEKHFASAVAYIENNPVKARLCEKAEDWIFSSAWWRKNQ
jgi:REP element-mobilizing transposase RayT